MSSTTHNLPFKRFVAQVSTGTSRPKSSFIALMAENLEALKKCPWREAADVADVALVKHNFGLVTHFDDGYDAYKMTGAWTSASQTEIAFAGMAAYRFKIPDAAAEVALSSISLPISRDRFLKGGVHLAVALSDDDHPSSDWDVVRGTGSISASAQLANTAEYLTAAQPADGYVTLAAADFSALAETGYDYLWVYVTLEDYTDWWDKYTADEDRRYAIEGSAMLVGCSSTATFASAVAADADPADVLLAGGSSPTWIQPMTTENAGTSAPAVPEDPFVEYFFSSRRSTTTDAESSISTYYVRGDNAQVPITITFSGKAIKSITGVGNGTWTKNGDRYWTFSGTPPSGIGAISQSITVNVTMADGGSDDTVVASGYVSSWCINGSAQTVGTSGKVAFGDTPLTVYDIDYYYYLMELTDGVPTDGDKCDSESAASRRGVVSSVTEVTSGTKWTLTIDGQALTVTKSSSTYTAKQGSATRITGTSAYGGVANYFDQSVTIHNGNAAVRGYGLAAAVGDFSAAVVTFDAGTQPSNAEMLGRLVRLSKARSAGLLYLHPAAGALANELDAIRPVPRFFRAAQAPAQTVCQPGISVWYKRPATGSAAASAVAYVDGAVSPVVKVTNPVFLQYALLALRTPSAASVKGISLVNSGSAVPNGFNLRFVAWKSAARLWDGSSSFALAAMAGATCVYQSDGEASTTWTVDCNGELMPMGERNVTAERIGFSPVVSGSIAAGSEIVIPAACNVDEGDVIFIAPEVLGFADGTGSASVYFGRQADPDEAESKGAWARYTADLGWFPRVTIIK